jgi:hypothetical protein
MSYSDGKNVWGHVPYGYVIAAPRTVVRVPDRTTVLADHRFRLVTAVKVVAQ